MIIGDSTIKEKYPEIAGNNMLSKSATQNEVLGNPDLILEIFSHLPKYVRNQMSLFLTCKNLSSPIFLAIFVRNKKWNYTRISEHFSDGNVPEWFSTNVRKISYKNIPNQKIPLSIFPNLEVLKYNKVWGEDEPDFSGFERLEVLKLVDFDRVPNSDHLPSGIKKIKLCNRMVQICGSLKISVDLDASKLPHGIEKIVAEKSYSLNISNTGYLPTFKNLDYVKEKTIEGTIFRYMSKNYYPIFMRNYIEDNICGDWWNNYIQIFRLGEWTWGGENPDKEQMDNMDEFYNRYAPDGYEWR